MLATADHTQGFDSHDGQSGGAVAPKNALGALQVPKPLISHWAPTKHECYS